MGSIVLPAGANFIIPYPFPTQSWSKSILTFETPVSATATLSCPGLSPITVSLVPLQNDFVLPALPQLQSLSNLQCLTTIEWEDSQGNTEQSEITFNFVKLNLGFIGVMQ